MSASVARPPSPEVIDRLLDIVAREGMVEREKLTMDAALDTLGVQSADIVVILMTIEDEFEVYISIDDELSEATTVGDLVAVVAARIEKNQERGRN